MRSLQLAACKRNNLRPSLQLRAAQTKRTDIYHVFVVKAALGKAKELTEWLKEPDPQHPDVKGILLRHQDGDSWDFVAIEHMGTKATVEVSATPMTPQQRLLIDWHADTYVAGPPWSVFAKKWESTATRPRLLARSTLFPITALLPVIAMT